MESKNIVTFKLPTTAYCRLGAAIVSKSQQGQKEYFVRDTELRGFFLRVRRCRAKAMEFLVG